MFCGTGKEQRRSQSTRRILRDLGRPPSVNPSFSLISGLIISILGNLETDLSKTRKTPFLL
jgi:hypothetical protein